MAGKVLFMEIRLLKCLLGGGPYQLAFLPHCLPLSLQDGFSIQQLLSPPLRP